MVDAFDPALRLRLSSVAIPEAQFLCVYRVDNWQNVAELADDCSSLGWPVLLHALDDPHPALASHTRSAGAGGRFQNLNRLLPHVDPARWTVISDDDVLLPHPGLGSLIALCHILAFDIAQPAHRADSYYSYRFTRRRPGVLARVTSFVEIGPIVVFSPAAWPWVSPFPEQGMGWGTSLEWHDLRSNGLTLGIVDSVPLLHLGAPNRGYDAISETNRLDELLHARGFQQERDFQHTDHTYPFWAISRLRRRTRTNPIDHRDPA
jgi:hypothetical protein